MPNISFHLDTSVCVTILVSTDRIRLNLIRMECNHSVWVHFGLLRILFSWMLGQKGPLWLFGNHLVKIIKFTGSTLLEILCICLFMRGRHYGHFLLMILAANHAVEARISLSK